MANLQYRTDRGLTPDAPVEVWVVAIMETLAPEQQGRVFAAIERILPRVLSAGPKLPTEIAPQVVSKPGGGRNYVLTCEPLRMNVRGGSL